MWRFLRNRRLILRLHYYLGTHILWAHRAVVPAIARLLFLTSLAKITTMRFNFLKLLDRILLYLFRLRYVMTSFLVTSRLRHRYVVMW